MHAAFVLHGAVNVRPLQAENDFFEAAHRARRGVEHFQLPALALGKTAVHAEQIAGKQRRLVAARAGPDFHNGVAPIHFVLGDQAQSQVFLDGRQPLLQFFQLMPGHADQFWVRLGADQLAQALLLGQQALVGFDRFDDGAQAGVFASQLGQPLRIGGHLRVRQRLRDFLVTAFDFLQRLFRDHRCSASFPLLTPRSACRCLSATPPSRSWPGCAAGPRCTPA